MIVKEEARGLNERVVLKSRSSKLTNLNSSVPNEDKRQPTKPERTSHEESTPAIKTNVVLARVQVIYEKTRRKKVIN